MDLFALFDFINIFIAIYLGALIYSNDPTNRLNRIFLIYAFVVAYTSFCQYFKLTAVNGTWALFWHKASFIWPFYAPLYLLIAIILLDKKNYVKIEYILIICLPAMLIAGTYIFTNVLYGDLRHYWYGWRFNSINNAYSFFVGIYFIIYGALSFFLIIKFYIRQKKTK